VNESSFAVFAALPEEKKEDYFFKKSIKKIQRKTIKSSRDLCDL